MFTTATAPATADLETSDLATEIIASSSPFPTLDQVPDRHAVGYRDQRDYLLNGEIRRWDGPLQEIVSPLPLINEQGETYHPAIGRYPYLTADVALQALDAAATAFKRGNGAWPQLSTEERIQCMETFVEKMLAVRDEVTTLLEWEIGKSTRDAEKEFDRTVQYIRESIVDLRTLEAAGKEIKHIEGTAAQVERSPLGVVLCMGPFNYPLNETFTTLIPALLMGNTVLFKTPKIGVLLYEPLLKAFAESFPAGVVNTIYGDGAEVITPLMKDGRVDVLAFIGSSRVADLVTKSHPAPHRLKTILGLGAKNPGIILPDADLERAASDCVTGALSFNGQRCTALKALFVHRSVAEPFLEILSAKVSALRQGMPWAPDVQITPLAESGKVEYMRTLIDDAVLRGARIVNPGGGESEATLFTPAILYPVSPEARLYREEQFGPLVPVVPYDSIDEVIGFIETSEVGQQLSVFGKDRETIQEIVQNTRNLVGRVNLNTQCQRGPDELPFTGRRSAAMGTLSIREALKIFSVETVLAGVDSEETARFMNR